MDCTVIHDEWPANQACWVPMDDGTRLMAEWSTAPRADRTIIMIHGCGEHGQRYQHVAAGCVQAGWNVLTLDLRGHGRSEGTATHVRRFAEYVDDLETVIGHFGLVASRTVLMGHSMGGLVALRFAQTYADRVAALVAVSPLLRLQVAVSRWVLVVGWLMSVVAPRTRFRSRVPPEHTTRSAEVLERRAQDTRIHRSVTAGCFFAMRDGMQRAWTDSGRLQLPMLVLQAGQDRIADPAATEAWLRQIPSPDKSFMLLADDFHEVLNEPEWRQTLVHVLQWLETRVPKTAPANGSAGDA